MNREQLINSLENKLNDLPVNWDNLAPNFIQVMSILLADSLIEEGLELEE